MYCYVKNNAAKAAIYKCYLILRDEKVDKFDSKSSLFYWIYAIFGNSYYVNLFL